MPDPADVLASVCAFLAAGARAEAEATVHREYPFTSTLPTSRAYTESIATGVFARDGFLDRYSGARLVFPGTLRLLSLKLPGAFPYHRNWKTSETHPAYWQLYATIDHIVPVTRGGLDDESNLVTTSMLRNSAKGAWLVEELGWELRAGGQRGEWDGLMSWFVNCVTAEPSLLQEHFIRRWYVPAKLRCGL